MLLICQLRTVLARISCSLHGMVLFKSYALNLPSQLLEQHCKNEHETVQHYTYHSNPLQYIHTLSLLDQSSLEYCISAPGRVSRSHTSSCWAPLHLRLCIRSAVDICASLPGFATSLPDIEGSLAEARVPTRHAKGDAIWCLRRRHDGMIQRGIAKLRLDAVWEHCSCAYS